MSLKSLSTRWRSSVMYLILSLRENVKQCLPFLAHLSRRLKVSYCDRSSSVVRRV